MDGTVVAEARLDPPLDETEKRSTTMPDTLPLRAVLEAMAAPRETPAGDPTRASANAVATSPLQVRTRMGRFGALHAVRCWLAPFGVQVQRLVSGGPFGWLIDARLDEVDSRVALEVLEDDRMGGPDHYRVWDDGSREALETERIDDGPVGELFASGGTAGTARGHR